MDEQFARDLNEATMHAVALLTLYATARAEDDRRTGALLDGYLAEDNGVRRTIGGFASLCGALLAIIEFETGVPAESTLQRIGVMAAAAQLGGRA